MLAVAITPAGTPTLVRGMAAIKGTKNALTSAVKLRAVKALPIAGTGDEHRVGRREIATNRNSIIAAPDPVAAMNYPRYEAGTIVSTPL